MKKLLCILLCLLITPAYAKDYCKRFPTDTAIECYTPTNLPPGGGGNVGIGSTMINGTTGSVLFVGPGPVFAQDNANFFWDDTGNNLGIGTITPASKLQVGAQASTGSATPQTISLGGTFNNATNGTASKLKLKLYDDAVNFDGISLSSVAGGFTQMEYLTHSGVDHAWYVAGAEKMRLAVGNLGIGSASPGALLDVAGTGRFTALANSGAYTQTGTSANTLTGATSGTSLALSGNLGVGGAGVASNALQVTGNGQLSGTLGVSGGAATSNYVLRARSDQSDVTILNVSNLTNDSVARSWLGPTSASGDLQVYSAPSNFATASWAGNQGLFASSNLIIGANVGYTAFQHTIGTEDMRVSSGGNLGIGSTAPGTKLDVTGDIRLSGNVDTALTASRCVETTTNGVLTVAAAACNTGGSSQWITYGQAGNVGIGTTDRVGIGTTLGSAGLSIMNGNVGIGTWNPTNALMIPSGNFGIGTHNANFPLQVVGTSSFAGNMTIAGVTFGGVTGTTNLVGSASPTFSGTVVASNITSSTIAGSGTSGNLTLLGTTSNSPLTTSLVHIKNTSGVGATNGIFVDNASNIGIGTIGPQPGKMMILGNIGIGTSLNGDTFLTTSPPLGGMIIEKNVGIGTVTPGTSLDISGNTSGYLVSRVRNTNTAGTSEFLLANDNTPFAGYMSASGTTASDPSAFHIGSDMNGRMGLWTNAAERVTILATGNLGVGTIAPQGKLVVWEGNVGIGTISPNQQLEVNGSIRTYGNTSNTYLNSSGGNVGIGSLTPGNTLDIVGTGPRVINANSVGWSVVTGASTACNTTCTFGCVVGFDVGTLGVALAHIVACTDASADECLCAGGS